MSRKYYNNLVVANLKR